MNRAILTLVALLVLSSASAPVFALEHDYFGASIGLNLAQDSSLDYRDQSQAFDTPFDPGLSLSAFFGHDYGNQVRFEGEVGYRSNTVEKFESAGTNLGADGDLTLYSLLFNVFWDIKTTTRLTPYLGGGLGGAFVVLDAEPNFSTVSFDDDDTVFAYQVGVGAGYEVNSNLTVDFGYRFFSAPTLASRLGFMILKSSFGSR